MNIDHLENQKRRPIKEEEALEKFFILSQKQKEKDSLKNIICTLKLHRKNLMEQRKHMQNISGGNNHDSLYALCKQTKES